MKSWFDVTDVTERHWAEMRAIRLEMLTDTPLAYVEALDSARARTEDDWRAWAARAATPHNCGVAAVERSTGRWIATMRGMVLEDGRAFLLGVYVAPAFRGRRRGVTDTLLDRVEDWARREDVDRLYLHVHELNARAQAFYERRNYVPTGALEPYPLDPTQSEIEMALDLRAPAS